MGRKLVHLLSFFLVSVLALASVAQAADPSLIGWWPLDEEEGDIAFDFSGYANDGLVSADVSWVPGDGQYGGAALWEGPDTAHVEISAANMSASAGTVMMWANLTDPQPAQTRYFFGHTTQPSYNNRIQLYMDGTTELDIGLGGAHAASTDIVTLPLATWLHIAMTWDNGSYVVYQDGQEIDSGSYNGLAEIHDIAWLGNDGNPVSQGTEAFGGMLDECRLYNRALSQEEVAVAMRTAASFGIAGDPSPANEATDIPRDVALGWSSGEFANTHDVYFGTTFNDVNDASRANPMDALVSQDEVELTYDPTGLLEFGQTYYWRIDAVNAPPDSTIFKGEIWSFTAEPLSYAIEGIIASDSVSGTAGDAQKTVDGSGLNENNEHSVEATDMWLAVGNGVDPVSIQYEFDRAYKLHEMLVWNYNIQFELVLGFGLKDVTIEYSLDGVEWMALGDVVFAQAAAAAGYTPNTTVDLGGVIAKHVRLTAVSGYGMMGQFGLSEVRFFQIPVSAREPAPADGETGVNPNTLLSWRAGRGAVSHDVSLGTDADALAVVDTVGESSYDPGAFDLGQTYYWKIDEVNEAATPSTIEGDVWSFSTQEYFIVDDFESYDDDANRIFDTWLDGFVNETGSTVGYFDAPFAEQTIVNSGGQSMPLEYANDSAPFYSEAELDLGSADWTANGADTLKLSVYGEAPAFQETADGDIFMNAIGTDIWGNTDELRFASKSLTGDGSITARVDALDGSPSTWAKGGVMVRQGIEGGAINTFMALTGGDGGGATFQQRMAADGASVSQHTYTDGPLAPPYWVRVTREGNTLMGLTSADGETWTQRGDTVTLAMTDPVLIGLALTSHNAAEATSAAFSNISTTGNVTSQWTVADIGVAQPTGGNAPEDLYVAVEDTSGNVAVVTSANGAARPGWNEWVIPFGDLGGVNLSRVAMMYIGVGDRDNPSAGGAGMIFVDDILVGHQAAAELVE